ncbi:UNVERIFIED_CONTAM: hypothetical protein PYX00_005700 [Menopon gallinae]|uniref:Uncharacterized protein n=1 Tax=Menopon gallinae TaxID=328185 RepID=A0AAW2HSH9_9NEOP
MYTAVRCGGGSSNQMKGWLRNVSAGKGRTMDVPNPPPPVGTDSGSLDRNIPLQESSYYYRISGIQETRRFAGPQPADPSFSGPWFSDRDVLIHGSSSLQIGDLLDHRYPA